jgi:AAA domain-containing protein
VELIKEAEAAGYAVVILDSLSYAWTGEGGLLEFVDKVTAASDTKDSFSAWRKATPAHNVLVDAMLSSPCHIIATLRTKTAYEVVDNGKGKKRPVKIGLAPVQRDGLEFEFTLVLDLSIEGHVATTSKDRTGLFDGQFWVPTEETGWTLRAWLDGGSPERPVAAVTPTPFEAVPVAMQVSEAAKQRIVKIVSRAARARAWLQAEALLEKEFAGDPETLAYARDQIQRAKQVGEVPVATAA